MIDLRRCLRLTIAGVRATAQRTAQYETDAFLSLCYILLGSLLRGGLLTGRTSLHQDRMSEASAERSESRLDHMPQGLSDDF
jgi:hypothetical protein